MREITLLAAIALIGFVVPASAQTGCDIKKFSAASEAVDYYLKAEDSLLKEKDPESALNYLTEMRKLDLNCLEDSSSLAMMAQVKINLQDYRGAIEDLQLTLKKGYVPENREAQILLAISQLYYQEMDLENGLAYSNLWLEAGGEPTRDQMYTFAQVYYSLDKYEDALVWLEQVFEIDGPEADQFIYEFLAALYLRTGDAAKQVPTLEAMIARYPGTKGARTTLAWAYHETGQTDASIALFETLLMERPNDDMLWRHYATVHGLDLDPIRIAIIKPDDVEIEGSCQMTFEIDLAGKPVNIDAECTAPELVVPATLEVQDAQLVPKMVDGVASAWPRMTFELEFIGSKD